MARDMHGGYLPDHHLRVVAVGSGTEDRGAEAKEDQGASLAAHHSRHLHAPHCESAQHQRDGLEKACESEDFTKKKESEAEKRNYRHRIGANLDSLER
ncbi:hypothetical protein PIB30_001003 [Stylosanthes scabra]|uniref:Uncharacterized protein n=1 Tax=Stylosanthes scabra TaxID=79078 RepID=A0ABU6T354_9FABA|nr:hypothetical protein [Stylosanthes scabra]